MRWFASALVGAGLSFEGLPDDVLESMLETLPLRDLVSTAATSTRFRALAEENSKTRIALAAWRLFTSEQRKQFGDEYFEGDAVNAALLVLIKRGDAVNVRRLLDIFKEKVDVNTRDADGWVPLHYAAKQGRTDMARLLFENGAQVNITTEASPYSLGGEVKHETPLHLASRGGHGAVVDFLLDVDGIEINAVNNFGQTPLYTAVQTRSRYVVELLLGYEADPNIADNADQTPLHRAAQSGNMVITRLLLRNGARVNAADAHYRKTALHYAAETNRELVVHMILRRDDVDVNAVDRLDTTPLHMAAGKGYTAVVRVLLDADGIQVNATNLSGQTPLHLAAVWGHKKVVQLLLSRDEIDVNAVDNANTTALYKAATNDMTAIVRLLLDVDGIDIDIRDRAGRTALNVVERRGMRDIALLLRAHREDF